MEKTEFIKQLIYNGQIEDAIEQLNICIENDPKSDTLYYLLGNAYRKKGDWRLAINNYLEAMEINPESPAKEAYKMVIDILEFYNKDMYNQ